MECCVFSHLLCDLKERYPLDKDHQSWFVPIYRIDAPIFIVEVFSLSVNVVSFIFFVRQLCLQKRITFLNWINYNTNTHQAAIAMYKIARKQRMEQQYALCKDPWILGLVYAFYYYPTQDLLYWHLFYLWIPQMINNDLLVRLLGTVWIRTFFYHCSIAFFFLEPQYFTHFQVCQELFQLKYFVMAQYVF